MNANFVIFNANFVIFNGKSIIFNTEFIDAADIVRCVCDAYVDAGEAWPMVKQALEGLCWKTNACVMHPGEWRLLVRDSDRFMYKNQDSSIENDDSST